MGLKFGHAAMRLLATATATIGDPYFPVAAASAAEAWNRSLAAPHPVLPMIGIGSRLAADEAAKVLEFGTISTAVFQSLSFSRSPAVTDLGGRGA